MTESRFGQRYRGRFAPSPTGPLHFGSLVAAVGSYLCARQAEGQWLLRMEDLDTPRVKAGAADDILRTLEGHGLTWDGEVLYQSQRQPLYQAALENLQQQGKVYACTCSRKAIETYNREHGLAEYRYPGLCRQRTVSRHSQYALRLLTDDQTIAFVDELLGEQKEQLAKESGDFIIRRADGLFAYQLAVVVDDHEQGVNHVVRGADLLHSTPRQIYLQQLLAYPHPRYLHLPLALDDEGKKLSKQDAAAPVDRKRPVSSLVKVLAFLGQQPPKELERESLSVFWQWAEENWNREHIPKQASRLVKRN